MNSFNVKTLSFLFSILLVTSSAIAQVTGASVTGVRIQGDRTVMITIHNLSQHDIKAWTVTIKAHYPGEEQPHQSGSTHENGGPPELEGYTPVHPLHPGDSVEDEAILEPGVESAEAELILAVYDDQTAEVKKGEEWALQNLISNRKWTARQKEEDAKEAKDPVQAKKLHEEALAWVRYAKTAKLP